MIRWLLVVLLACYSKWTGRTLTVDGLLDGHWTLLVLGNAGRGRCQVG